MKLTLPLFCLIVLAITSCGAPDYSPKPRAYHRIKFPEKSYKEAPNDGCPYTLVLPSYTTVTLDANANAQPCWKNINFPQFNATIHLSYYSINPKVSLESLTEDARTFAFKHTPKASSIDQITIASPENHIYGIRYAISGDAASNDQFYLTDSSTHYLRAALYFNEKPRSDSIRPVLDFIKQDIDHLIANIRWK